MSSKYHKIQTVYKRNPDTNFKTLMEGEFSLPEFKYLKDNVWTFNEKIDGTNIRIIWDGEAVSFRGKTDRAQIPPFLLNRLEGLFAIETLKAVFPDGEAILYGEGYGNRIQKAGKFYIADGTDFILFDIKVGDIWLERSNVEDVAQKLSIDITPIIGEGTLLEGIEMTRKGFPSRWAHAGLTAEGLILRPKIELSNRDGHRIITKIKHKDFR